MRKLMMTALIAAVAMPAMAPVAANAQSHSEIRRDVRDVRQEQRELRNAYRRGDRGDIREERRDVRDARRELREDVNDRNRRWGRDDWRGWRSQNRTLFARGRWNAPFRYTPFRSGMRIPRTYWGSRYWINDPWRYRLPPARPFERWVRHFNDVILIDTRRGVVVDVIRNFYW